MIDLRLAVNPHQALADQLTGKDCTLNGKPASISGRLCRFAIIATLDGRETAEFSWLTAAHMLANKQGKFRS